MPQEHGFIKFVDIPVAEETGEYQLPTPPAPQDELGVMFMKHLLGGIPDLLPAAGATAGGIIGGAGGSAFGMGFGGIPGAMGGAALGGGAGEAGRQLVNRALGREAPASPAQAAADIGSEAVTQGAIEGVGGVATQAAKSGATTLYRGYLKPALNQVDLPKAREIVQTALQEGLAISKAGEDKAKRLISELNRQVNSALQNVSGGRVDLRQIADRVRAFAQQKYNRPGVPQADFEAAMKVADEIDNHPALAAGAGRVVAVNPADANAVKQGLDQAIGDRAFGVERGAATEARKTGRRATRLAIEGQAPEVGPLNAREAQIIDALEAIQRATGREENRNLLFGVPTMISGALGGLAGYNQGDPTQGLLAGLLARGLLTPQVASRAAILASRFARIPGTAPATAVRIAVQVAESEDQFEQPQ